MNTYKPSGYNSVSPYFIVKGAQQFVDFLKELFDAKEKRRYDHADGSIMHIELEIDDSIIMIGDSSEQYPPNNHLMHVYVKDVDAIYYKAIQLGCTEVEKPKSREGDSDKRGMFQDHAGNTWAVATQLL